MEYFLIFLEDELNSLLQQQPNLFLHFFFLCYVTRVMYIIMNKHLELESDYTYMDSTIITIISAAAAITSAIASIVNLINSKVELKKIKGIVDRK